MSEGTRLRKVGAIWKPKLGSRSKGSGSLVINGWRQRFVIVVNDRKTAGSTQPDYLLMSSEEPALDPYGKDDGRSARRVDANF